MVRSALTSHCKAAGGKASGQGTVLVLALALAVAACQGGHIGDEEEEEGAAVMGAKIGSESQAIVNGALSVDDEQVVALVFHGKQFCSGTVVGRRTILTAAHCLPPNIEIPYQSIEVYFASDISDRKATRIRVVDALANPEWTSDVVAGDVGVLALAEDSPVPPMPMAYLDVSAAGLLGKEVRAVGFGITEVNGSGNGKRRMGLLTVARYDSSSLYLAPGPSATCNGDSGGALLFMQDGIEVIGGIHSRSDCGSIIIAERVDVHAMDFIMPFLEAHEGAASCGDDGMCATGCDQPDPDCLCAADGMCTDVCAHPSADLDCTTECPVDGVCDESCGFDFDCVQPEAAAGSCAEGDASCEAATTGGGCSTGGSSGGSVWLALALLLLFTGSRRRDFVVATRRR